MKLFTILASVGAVNWLLEVLGWNLVEALLGFSPILVDAVYVVVGISGVLVLLRLFKCGGQCSNAKECDTCSTEKAPHSHDTE